MVVCMIYIYIYIGAESSFKQPSGRQKSTKASFTGHWYVLFFFLILDVSILSWTMTLHAVNRLHFFQGKT